ncbi:alpha/beta hydrolase [Candidatus Woesearchaeota archaeon]|nr:alpha/beta hydrolase [Candidatus Woesearchaeota archaeon]
MKRLAENIAVLVAHHIDNLVYGNIDNILDPQAPTVAYIHGAWSTGQCGRGLLRYLRAEGINTQTLSYDFYRGVAKSEPHLADQIRKISDKVSCPIVIVGHSMGGVIATSLAQQMDEINGSVSLAGPVRGNPLAYLTLLQRELTPDSTYIKALHARPLRCSSLFVAGNKDMIVRPDRAHWSFPYNNHAENVSIPNADHLSLVSEPVYEIVANFVKRFER